MSGYVNVQRVVAAVEQQDLSIENQEALANALLEACNGWARDLQTVAMKGELGAPDWQLFELKIWALGESLRLFLKRKKNWRGPGPVMDAVAAIVSSKDFMKGRQTFALLLGDFGGASYANKLGELLCEPDVRGHAVKSLTKLRAPGFETQVQRIATTEKGWIRNAARRYLAAVSRSD